MATARGSVEPCLNAGILERSSTLAITLSVSLHLCLHHCHRVSQHSRRFGLSLLLWPRRSRRQLRRVRLLTVIPYILHGSSAMTPAVASLAAQFHGRALWTYLGVPCRQSHALIPTLLVHHVASTTWIMELTWTWRPGHHTGTRLERTWTLRPLPNSEVAHCVVHVRLDEPALWTSSLSMWMSSLTKSGHHWVRALRSQAKSWFISSAATVNAVTVFTTMSMLLAVNAGFTT